MLQRSVKTVGYKFEDYYLAKDLVAELDGTQSSFSLLQFACQVMWQYRDKQRRLLTRADHEDIGGVTGALVQHAEGVVKSLTNEEAATAKTLFLRLFIEDKARRMMQHQAPDEFTSDGGGFGGGTWVRTVPPPNLSNVLRD